MADRAAPLSPRALQLGTLRIDLGVGSSEPASTVSLPQFLGSLASLALIIASLGGLAPARSAATYIAAPVAEKLIAARPALGPAPIAPTRPAPEIDQATGELTEPMSDEAVAALAFAALPTLSFDVAPETSSLREVANQLQIDTTMLAAYNGIGAEAADAPLEKAALSVPIGILEFPGLKLREDPPVFTAPSVAYTIVPGDTLLEIAIQFGLEAETLVAANGLSSADFLQVGRKLQISGPVRPAAALVPIDAAISAPFSETASAPVALGPSAPSTYEVAPGDTVSEIAERFGVDSGTIVGTNNLRSADSIRIGDQLTILPVSGVMHTVRAGQTLYEIAALYRVDLGPIIDFNYIDDADLIPVDKDLIIPGGRPLPAQVARPASSEYQISPGDTLSSIAVRFGVPSGVIASANALPNPDRLAIGTRLTIPGVSAATQQGAQQIITRNLPVVTPSSPSVNLPVPTSGAGGNLATIALRYLGSRYIYGGTTPAGFDCSGLVYYVQAQSGDPVSRGMWGQYAAGPHPSINQLLPGDLVFFQNTYMAGLSHNGIYIGGGQFIHASDERSGVKISSIHEAYWASRWFGATRAW